MRRELLRVLTYERPVLPVALLTPPEHVDHLVPAPGDKCLLVEPGHSLHRLRVAGDDKHLSLVNG